MVYSPLPIASTASSMFFCILDHYRQPSTYHYPTLLLQAFASRPVIWEHTSSHLTPTYITINMTLKSRMTRTDTMRKRQKASNLREPGDEVQPRLTFFGHMMA